MITPQEQWQEQCCNYPDTAEAAANPCPLMLRRRNLIDGLRKSGRSTPLEELEEITFDSQTPHILPVRLGELNDARDSLQEFRSGFTSEQLLESAERIGALLDSDPDILKQALDILYEETGQEASTDDIAMMFVVKAEDDIIVASKVEVHYVETYNNVESARRQLEKANAGLLSNKDIRRAVITDRGSEARERALRMSQLACWNTVNATDRTMTAAQFERFFSEPLNTILKEVEKRPHIFLGEVIDETKNLPNSDQQN